MGSGVVQAIKHRSIQPEIIADRWELARKLNRLAQENGLDQEIMTEAYEYESNVATQKESA